MGQFSTITINDGATTPVAHAFTPVNESPDNVFNWADKVGGVPVGMPRLQLELREAKGKANVSIVNIAVEFPILETATGATSGGFAPVPTVAHIGRFKGQFYLPIRSTTQNRKDLHAFVYNALNTTAFKEAIIDLLSVY